MHAACSPPVDSDREGARRPHERSARVAVRLRTRAGGRTAIRIALPDSAAALRPRVCSIRRGSKRRRKADRHAICIASPRAASNTPPCTSRQAASALVARGCASERVIGGLFVLALLGPRPDASRAGARPRSPARPPSMSRPLCCRPSEKTGDRRCAPSSRRSRGRIPRVALRTRLRVGGDRDPQPVA